MNLIRKAKCKMCGKTDCYLSRARLCTECSMQKCKDVGMSIKNKKGKYYENYKKAMLKYLGSK